MDRYSKAIVDVEGRIVPGLSVRVVNALTSALVMIFSDRLGITGKANPFVTGPDGVADFHVEDGLYNIEAYEVSTGRLLVSAPEVRIGVRRGGGETNERVFLLPMGSVPPAIGRCVVIENDIAIPITNADPRSVTGLLGLVIGAPSATTVRVALPVSDVALPSYDFTAGTVFLGGDGFPSSIYPSAGHSVPLGSSEGGDSLNLNPTGRAL